MREELNSIKEDHDLESRQCRRNFSLVLFTLLTSKMSLDDSADIIQSLEVVLAQLREHNIPVDDVQRYVDQCTSCVGELNGLLRDHLSQSETRRCLSLLGQAETLIACFDSFLTRGGGAIQRPRLRGRRLLERRVKWTELEQAFQNRISTGVVSNIEHIDVDNFLDDARTLFISKVSNLFLYY